jgi:branched-chain amino acid transport system permease protein
VGEQWALALLEGVVTGSVLALTALGLSLVFGVMRIVNVAQGEFFMLGAVAAWYVATLTGSFLAAIVVGPLLVGAIALAADRIVLRPIGYAPEPTIVATIGLLYILQQTMLLWYGPEARSVAAPVSFTIELPWFGYSGYKLIVVVLAACLLGITWAIVARTRLGLYMRATQQNAEIARSFGIPVERVYSWTFAVGCAITAAAGVLIVPIQQAHYLMGGDALLLSFMVVTIGGLGSLGGTIAAAFLIGLVDGVVSVFFAPTLARIVAALFGALVLVVRAGGWCGERAPPGTAVFG